jgi:hypothetical protein
MCKSTTRDRTPSQPPNAGKLPAPGTAGATQPLTPFAAVAYPTLDLDPTDGPLKQALTDSITATAGMLGSGQKVAFSILCLTTNGHHRYAGVDDNTMHYSASLLKVAAMYAAHELLAAATRLARTPGAHRASPAAFYAGLESTFDQQIKDAALPNVLAAAEELATKLAGYRSTPSYPSLFEVTATGSAGAPSVDFSADFTAKMTNMIEWSDDPDAGECIRRLSYTYINGALIKAGFYDKNPPTPNGIWLAGDYSEGSHPYARVNSQNDKLVAQATTTRQMLRVFALIRLNKLVTQDGNNARMKTLLALAASHGGWFHFGPLSPPANQPFDLVLSKIGRGPLKKGGETFSEAQLLRWTSTTMPAPATKGLTGDFVVCWQNLQIAKIAGIVEVFRRTYTKLLT